jgi:hypothetical protein
MDDKSQFNESLGLFERSPERKVCEKYEWPELVGKEAYQAEELIKQDNVELQIKVIEEGVPVIPDFQVQRVRILLNDQGKVK